jgi:hypothetical protein
LQFVCCDNVRLCFCLSIERTLQCFGTLVHAALNS